MDRKWWTLLATCVAMFMLLLDITIVNVALPEIQRDLDASFSDLQWVVDAYSLTLAAFLLTAGSLGDRIGRRRVFVAGFAIFTVASLLCGLASHPTTLNLARALQGVGGAAMFATTLALIAQEFQGPQRATAFGIWGATIGGAVAIGPLVGGALTDALGWEWIFFVNVPIGIAAIALTLRKVAESRSPDAVGIDWPGFVSFSTALFLLVFALVRGNAEGWSSVQITGSLVLAGLLLLAFVAIELRSSHPMFELSLFRKPAFIGVSIVAFCLSASMFALFLYVTIYIQDILGFGPLEAGVRFLPITLLSFFVAPVAGQLLTRIPARAFFGLGLGLVGAGLLLMRGLSVDSEWTALLPGFLLAGAGIGMTNPAIASIAVGVVPTTKAGMGSGINNTFRQVGIATGIAGLGAVFQHQIESKLADLLPGAPAELGEAVASSGTRGAEQGGPGAVDAAREAFVGAFNEILLIGAVIALVGAVLGLLLTRDSDLVAEGSPHG
ncbi:MAG: MFS transporter [Actinomycetota bacterium]|nr:MFS transporter [Actinomycetota bacterium]